MNRSPTYKNEVSDAVRGEIRRAAQRAVENLEAIEVLAALGLDATDGLFSDASSADLRRLAQQLRALSRHGARSLAEVERVTGILETLAAMRDLQE